MKPGINKETLEWTIKLRVKERTLNEKKSASINGIGPKIIGKQKKFIFFHWFIVNNVFLIKSSDRDLSTFKSFTSCNILYYE